MVGTLTAIRLDTRLADEAAKVLAVKTRTEAVHVALREIVALKGFKALIKKDAGNSPLPDTVRDIIVFDTSVLVGDLRTARHQAKIQSLSGLLRTSSVVLAELLAGRDESC